ncbi:MAG TPA: copper amine oxidase N-terminal domain-containing protein, partial [Bacillota bacterium]
MLRHHALSRRRPGLLPRLTAALLIMVLVTALAPAPAASQAPGEVRVVVDGRALRTDPAPMIDQGRTLIPLRAVFEALGAEVAWHEAERKVTAVRGGRTVSLRIDLRLACLDAACRSATLLDVPARIHQERTFVPLRFVATALGAGVDWNPATRTVTVTTQPGEVPDPGSGVRITAPAAGQPITGPTRLKVQLNPGLAGSAAEVRYFLLDAASGRGPIVARGAGVTAEHTWLPDPLYDGARLLAAAVYDGAGRFLAGDVVPVTVAVAPQVNLRGPVPGQQVTGPLELAADVNFVAARVRYERVDAATGQASTLAEADPYGPFTWTPGLADNGPAALRVVAVDRLGREHPSAAVPITVQVARRLELRGVSASATVSRPVTLSTSANFGVQRSRFILRDPSSGAETVLGTRDGAGSLRWIPSPDQNGARQLLVEAVDAAGAVHRSSAVDIRVSMEPAIFLETVGPNQVLAGEVSLRAASSVPLDAIDYELIDGSGRARRIAGGSDAAATYTWRPAAGDAGDWRL